jgi:type II secretory pathway component GspD/PulD (secretin)
MSTILSFLSRPLGPAILGSLLALSTVGLGDLTVAAADPDLVGVIALTTEEPVAKELQLTAEQKQKLADLMHSREVEAVDIVAKAKDASPAERSGRLEPFRRETEARGRMLLSPQQVERLDAIRLRRLGVAALVEPLIADRLKLDAKQKSDIANILKDRDQRIATAEKAALPTIQADAERALRGLLNEGQRVAWESLAAINYPPLSAPAATLPAAASPTVASQTASPSSAASQAAMSPAATTPAAPVQAAAAQPAAAPPVTAPAIIPGKDAKLRFSFRFQPWKDVLDWFAQQAGLSLVMDAPPVGTFNYTDDREYTPAEAIDLLNSVLLTKGYTLVRRERMLMLINLQDGIPPNLVPMTTLDDLDKRGEFELVSVLFNVDRLSPEEAEAEVKKLLGPQGAVVVLASARQLLITDTAGRLRSIRSVLERIEKPDGAASGQVRIFDLRHAASQNVLDVLRPLLDIPADKTAAADGSVRFAVDSANQRLLVSGKPDKVSRVADILKLIDVPEAPAASANPLANSAQLEVYSITSADPDTVLNVLKTLLNGMPDVRLDVDAKNGSLIAMARPEQQATIRATLDQLQRDARRVEVIPLLHLDPQTAVASISRLFPASSDSKGSTPPQVDADSASRQLLVRGTPSQIEQIHALLLKLGETPDQEGAGSTVRMLPLTGASARSALERLQEIWPTLHPNKIHVVTPTMGLPAIRPSSAETSSAVDPNLLNFLMQQRAGAGAVRAVVVPETTVVPRREPSAGGPSAKPAEAPAVPPSNQSRELRPAQGTSAPAIDTPRARQDRSTLWTTVRVVTVADTGAGASPAPAPMAPPVPQAQTKAAPAPSQQPAPIFVLPGPNGLIVASQDVQALNQFEQLLRSVAGNTSSSGNEYTIFYLKNAKADSVAETLDRVFGSGTMPAAGPGADMMGGGAGGAGGGDSGLGALMALGSSSGSVKITADSRLNALIVQASANDLDTVEQLLKVLDQKESPEDINVAPKPKIIPVYNTQASEVADIIRQVYQDRMASGSSSNSGGGPGGFGGRGQGFMNPLAMLAMMRMGGGGGGGGRRGGGAGGGLGGMMNGMMGGGRGRGSAVEDVQKMSIGVDTRANSLIVVAPEPLFAEVRQLVEQVDQAAVDSKQTMNVVTVHGTNMSTIQQAVLALTGGTAQANMVGSSTSSPQNSSQQAANFGALPGQHPPAPLTTSGVNGMTAGGLGGAGGYGSMGAARPTSSAGFPGMGGQGMGGGAYGAGGYGGANRSMMGAQAGSAYRPGGGMSTNSASGMGGPGGGYGGAGGYGGGRGGGGYGGAGGAGGGGMPGAGGGGSSMFGGGSGGGSRGTGSY